MNGKIKATRHFLLAVTFVATSVLSAFAQISPCLVEAEAFADKGGWVVDPQFVEQMGSPYLLAHGKGIPVADAKTSVNIKPGRVRAFVRTRDWTPDWDGEKPRKEPGIRIGIPEANGNPDSRVFAYEPERSLPSPCVLSVRSPPKAKQ